MDESTQEHWRDVLGTDGWYQVSDQGRVRSCRTESHRMVRGPWRVLKPTPLRNAKGRVMRCIVSLYADGGTKRKPAVHVLVLEAFVGPRPVGTFACHYDDDSMNNRLDNLRWDTQAANEADKIRNGGRILVDACGAGHPLTEDNVYRRPGHQTRNCRECRRRWMREHKLRARAYHADHG